MKKNVQFFAKSTLTLSMLVLTSMTHAELSLQQQVDQLQQQVQALQELVQQQQKVYDQKLNEQKIATAPVVVESVTPQKAPSPVLQHTTKGGAEFELYGNVRADMSYQMKGPSTMYNLISGVPLEGTAEERKNSDKFQSTLNATRFGFNFKTPQLGDHAVGGKVEMDFFGGAGRDTFRIRHAYMTYDQWLLGQTWSNFNAVEYYPETVDASLSVGGSLTRVPQIKYSVPVNPNVNLAFSLEDSKAETVTRTGTQNFTTDPDAKLKLPSATGRINYKFDNGSAVSGRTFVTQKATNHAGSDDFLAWGVGLGGKYQATENTLVRVDYNHIKGDTKNLLWSNMAYVFDDNNKMRANQFDAITVGLTQKLTPKIRSTLGFGYMKADDNNAFSRLVHNDETQNAELKEGWINLFYNPVKPVNFGLEYMYGERKTFNDKTGIDNRLNFTAIYDF
ncbi:DcaP-like protein [Acinetobacter sp. ANC 5054]|uniref:DcaP family trimeric outer membrane transporter n=1 Tax=Acinetobacter sp. ANC 5054 TaxID=1977877 RepID=UPI000A32B4FE|nr:DcaP family trimeric outer membrane transporter [Acinetobacter sp. ANC 5054]OTG79084.1 DcaP-like protein [Acinetobacter sp. ANC 5054]